MSYRYTQSKPHRVAVLRSSANAGVNGIDYVEVAQTATGAHVTVRFVRDLLPDSLGTSRVRIEGGVRFGPPPVVAQTPANGPATDSLTFTTLGATDFSRYRLRLVKSQSEEEPPAGFDPELSEIELEFKADCPSEFDCAETALQPPIFDPVPPIDYLAKDYESFRRLMLDRMSVTLPDWKERNPADLGIVLVETLAHSADVLSHMQDAVATEAYLGTARRRTSVRRHCRLLDYPLHDGCNARAFVHLEVAGEVRVKVGTPFLIRRGEAAALSGAAVEDPRGPVFEAMEAVTCWPAHNAAPLHDFFDLDCVLPKGTTRATLWDTTGLTQFLRGNVLLFEEVCSEAGVAADADPERRAIVRLSRAPVVSQESILGPDEVAPRRLVHLEWDAEDALPFDFHLYAPGPDGPQPRTLVRGNLVLVDHGRTLEERPPDIDVNETGQIRLRFQPVSRQARTGNALDEDGKALPFEPFAPAANAMRWGFQSVLPEVRLIDENDEIWLPEGDLLGAGRFSRSFVLESEDDGRAMLRFGDGVRGAERPAEMRIVYRVGNGTEGNVGAEAIGHICIDNSAVLAVRNPLPATGGVNAEPVRLAKLCAPYAFQRAERAVTEADYADLARRHPEVQRAFAMRRWTGSWTSVVLLVDRVDGAPLTEDFCEELRSMFDAFRMAGYDVEIEEPVFVPLDLAITVCLAPEGFRAHARVALREAFGRFFDPDRLTFGQGVFVSEVIAEAMALPGVRWVDLEDIPSKPSRFRRFGRPPAGEFAAGQIALAPREIARCDSDPNFPENGRIEFILEGGR